MSYEDYLEHLSGKRRAIAHLETAETGAPNSVKTFKFFEENKLYGGSADYTEQNWNWSIKK